MGKQIALEMATPANEYLKKLTEKKESERNQLLELAGGEININYISKEDEVKFIREQLAPLINPDVCIRDQQKGKVGGLIEGAATESHLKLKNEVLAKTSENPALNLAILINSFRFECERCLKTWCDKRDPELKKMEENLV